MSSDGDKQAAEETSGSVNASSGPSPEADLTVTIGATVPTGFEHTAAEEVKEKIGADARVSRDRGRIYFPVSTDKLFQVHRLRSVDNLFVVVQEYDQFLFKDSKEETLKELQELASKLPWTNALEVWRLNRTLKKKKSHRKVATATKATADCEVCDAAGHQQQQQEESAQQHQQQQQEESAQEQQHQQQHQEESAQQHQQQQHHQEESAQEHQQQHQEESAQEQQQQQQQQHQEESAQQQHHQQQHQEESAQQHQQQHHQEESAQEQQQHHQQHHQEESAQEQQQHHQQHHQEESAQEQTKGAPDPPGTAAAENLIKFRVTCNRAGDKHSFSSNEAARDFGGAVQEFFQWKADMTKFDVEVLLNIHNEEMVVGIALTEESLHRRNISHFGPTTLRSTLCYGMLRLCKLQASDIVLDPMCGTGAIPLEGAIEFNSSFYIAGDNNDMAVSRTLNNICHIQRRRAEKGSLPGLPVDTVQWDLCRLPIRTGSVDVIITDMPFGKRMGSRKKNWDLYPSCLREMARVCQPGSGKAVLLTQDKKCFSKAISRMGGLWKKLHTVWVNVGGLHAGVYLLKRTAGVFGQTPEDVHESPGRADKQTDEKGRH